MDIMYGYILSNNSDYGAPCVYKLSHGIKNAQYIMILQYVCAL